MSMGGTKIQRCRLIQDLRSSQLNIIHVLMLGEMAMKTPRGPTYLSSLSENLVQLCRCIAPHLMITDFI
jgi:hypothetical protein